MSFDYRPEKPWWLTLVVLPIPDEVVKIGMTREHIVHSDTNVTLAYHLFEETGIATILNAVAQVLGRTNSQCKIT
jgi:hypothetical protein